MTELALEDLPDLQLRLLKPPGVAGGVTALLTLNRPDKRNAMTSQMTASWGGVLARLAAQRAETDIRAVVVTGAGQAFCAGGDVAWIGSQPDASADQHRDRMLPFYRTWLAIRELEVPTIAAINGAAIGAGLALALACDLRYAAEDAQLSTPFTSLGLHPGMASTYLLPEVAGLAMAREMLLTGRVVSGREAVASGLVNATAPSNQLLEQALTVAARIGATAPLAARLTKRALSRGAAPSLEGALEWEALAQPLTMTSGDLREGLLAQQEHRSPRFTGS